MTHALRLHPDSRCAALTSIEVQASRPDPAVLSLVYDLRGAIGALYWPPPAASARADDLWRRTCVEAFLKPGDGDAYFEFNFAPSRQWAAYSFTGYRTGGEPLALAVDPQIAVQTTADRCEVRVRLDLSGLRALSGGAPWRMGLSAVIEETDGGRSYWALTHPPGKADFHHSSAFACEIRPAETL